MKLMGTDNKPQDPKSGLPLMSEKEKASASHLKNIMILVVI